MPPILHPLKIPSELNTISQDFLQRHPDFCANLTNLYMTPTNYKFTLPPSRRTDHFIAYASRQQAYLYF